MSLTKNLPTPNKRALVAVVGLVALAVLGGFPVVLSFGLAALAVVAAQEIGFLSVGRSLQVQRAFYFWSVKFSLTILFLCIALRGLHEGGLLNAPLFIGGVVVGLCYNFLAAVRFGDKMTAKKI